MFFNPMGLPQRLIEMILGSAQPRYTVVPERKGENRGKGKGGVPSLLVLHEKIRRAHSSGHPERPRHWHNPADPIQSARIEAAAHERARKAEARETVIFRGWYYNKAHEEGSNLDPYRIASA